MLNSDRTSFVYSGKSILCCRKTNCTDVSYQLEFNDIAASISDFLNKNFFTYLSQ